MDVSVTLFTFPGIQLLAQTKERLKKTLLKHYKESIRSHVIERNDVLVERKMKWEWEDLGFFPASTSDQMCNLQKNHFASGVLRSFLLCVIKETG